MGYYMSQGDCSFFIPVENIKDMLKVIHNLANCEGAMSGGQYSGGKKTSSHYSWVNMKFPEYNDIVEVFDCWRWHIEVDKESGNILDIGFNGEKLGDDFILFNAIAPFVKPGSFIEMHGEDNAMWRWYFNGETCIEQYPTITWN